MRRRTRSVVAGALATAGLLTVTLVAPVAATAAPAAGVRGASISAEDTSRAAAASRASRQASAAAAMRAKAVAIGKRKAGRASYAAGHAGPNAFDCSGFTSWVWKQAGRTIPRSSFGQYAGLKKISRSQARAGDLVFFFGGGSHHVGLYLGNGRMVHAANTRLDVLVSHIDGPWYSSRLSGFRRVV